jgi:hypothetical protein
LATALQCDVRPAKAKPVEPSSDRVVTAGEAARGGRLEVLNNLPVTQLIPVMKSITAGLGVGCEFCHTFGKDGQLDTNAPEKEEQKTARAMMKMVREINQRNFGGKLQVSCFTCHAGHPHPQSVPDLPVTMVAAEPSATPAPLPIKAETIISSYVNAIGGEEAMAKIKSCSAKGKYQAANGTTGTYETEAMAPDKGYEVITTSGGSRKRILVGGKGWEKSAYGVRVLLTDQAIDTELVQPFLFAAQLKGEYSQFEVAGQEKIDNADVYVLNATRRDKIRERLYFDAQTGLLVRRVTFGPAMIGLLPEQVDFADYRDAGGIKLPFTVRVATADATNPSSTRTLDEVKLNPPIDHARFDKPTEK